MAIRQLIWRWHLHHVLFWTLVGCVWFYLRHQDYDSYREAAWITAIKVADLALVIYFANGILVPRLLYRKKYGAFALAFIGAVALSSFLKLVAMSFVQPDERLLDFSNMKVKVYNNFVTQFFLVLAGIGLKSVFDYLKVRKELAEVAREKAEAELNFLKSQINPHFLFNSLNAVYFLIDRQNTAARDALHRFSEMLRYQLYECQGEKIPIEKEVGYLKDYVDLQQLRMNEHTEVQFRCEPDVHQFSIEPLLLIPFVENSFKHLSHFSNGRKNEVQIRISRANGTMHFSVYNTTEGGVSRPGEGGIGLANVQKRLQLLYPQKHELKVKESGDWFGVELSLSVAG